MFVLMKFLKQPSWILHKMFVLMISRSSLNWVTWCQKLGHQAKWKKNLVDTLEVTFLKWSSWILLKMFVLIISQSSDFLKFFRLGQFFSNYCPTEWYLALVKCLCLGQFLSNYCSYNQWYLVHAYNLAWPLEFSHSNLALTSISQPIRHATLTYLLI